MTTHLAATSLSRGSPFTVQSRPTPKPGPGELLVHVRSIALNPADYHMRDTGLMVPAYPAILGFDFSGLVLEVGDNVPTSDFRPGVTRIAAYSASVWRACDPDYGAFQEKCIVPWQHAVPLPKMGISWNEAATLSVAFQVPLNAWDVLRIPRTGEGSVSLSGKNEVLLIWGASSSVGTGGVQTSRILRDDPGSSFAAVYAVAGAANHEYVASLGADRLFDYKEPEVVDAIVSAAKEDCLVIRHCFLANGDLKPCQAVLKAFVGGDQKAKIASAPLIPGNALKVDGVETIFVLPSMADEAERLAQFQYWMGTWLREKLANGLVVPSPMPKVVGRGLDAINHGLDTLRQGVSCAKLVVEISD